MKLNNSPISFIYFLMLIILLLSLLWSFRSYFKNVILRDFSAYNDLIPSYVHDCYYNELSLRPSFDIVLSYRYLFFIQNLTPLCRKLLFYSLNFKKHIEFSNSMSWFIVLLVKIFFWFFSELLNIYSFSFGLIIYNFFFN